MARADEGEVAGVPPMKSLRTSLRILNEFAGDQRDYGVGEIAERCGLAKSQVSKVLDAFAEYGLLVQDPDTRRYSVGVRTFALGSRFVTHDRLCRAAMPVMRDLVISSGHSVRLSVLDADRVLYLIGLEGPLFFDSGWRSGTWLPVHSTSTGRVLLAFMDPEHAARLWADTPFRKVTPHTITDEKEVRKRVAEVRIKGYSSQRNETTPGLGAIAVPLFGPDQHAIGTLGMAFPSHLVDEADEPALAAALHLAARTLSQRMGCTVYPFGGMAQPARPPASPVAAVPARAKPAAKTRAKANTR